MIVVEGASHGNISVTLDISPNMWSKWVSIHNSDPASVSCTSPDPAPCTSPAPASAPALVHCTMLDQELPCSGHLTNGPILENILVLKFAFLR